MPEKTDARVVRTREILIDALVSLMQEKDAERITVAVLVREAGISRSTFYTHYADMPTFLDGVTKQVIDDLMGHIVFEDEPRLGYRTMYPSIYRYVFQHKGFFRAMLGPHGYRRFQEELVGRIQRNIEGGLVRGGYVSQGALTPQLIARYMTAAGISIITLALADDNAYTPEAFAIAVARLSFGGVLSAAGCSIDSFEPVFEGEG